MSSVECTIYNTMEGYVMREDKYTIHCYNDSGKEVYNAIVYSTKLTEDKATELFRIHSKVVVVDNNGNVVLSFGCK